MANIDCPSLRRLLAACMTVGLVGCASDLQQPADTSGTGAAKTDPVPQNTKIDELSGTFGLGLDDLSWGQRWFEIDRIFFHFQRTRQTPDYSIAADPSWGLAYIAASQHSYAGCSFTIRLHRYRDRLDQIDLDSVGSVSPCRDRIEMELRSRFGMSDRSGRRPGDVGGAVHREWEADGTSVTYDFDDRIRIRLVDQNDMSGRKAAAQNPMCQEISVQIAAGQDAPGVSGLTLSGVRGISLPAARQELGCYFYNPMLLQFSTQGTVQFEMHVLADGTVATADIVSAMALADPGTKSSLLGLFAQTFAWKLQFTPATRDGQPIEVIRRVDIVYTIKHPIVYPRSRAIN